MRIGVALRGSDFTGEGRPFEIEHIWANQYERFAGVYAHPSDFDEARNRFGGLLLLQRGLNQSLGDETYENKRDAYLSHSQNLLARSLHPLAYKNNPAFLQLIEQTGLPFRAYEAFGPTEQIERQELYIRIAEWVWNPSRLDLDGEKPPIPSRLWTLKTKTLIRWIVSTAMLPAWHSEQVACLCQTAGQASLQHFAQPLSLGGYPQAWTVVELRRAAGRNARRTVYR